MDIRHSIRDSYLFLRRLPLACCRLPASGAGRHPAMPSPVSIAAVRIDRIGDMVASLSGLRGLKALFPQAKLSVIGRGSVLPLLEGQEWIDELIEYRGFFPTLAMVRRRRFSLAVDMLADYTLKTAFFCRFSGAGASAGFDIAGRGKLFTVSAGLKDKKSMYSHILDLVQAIGRYYGVAWQPGLEKPPYLDVTPVHRQAADDFLRSQGITAADMLIGMHPSAAFPSQRWPPEKFAQLAVRLSRAYQARIILLGSDRDIHLLQTIKSLMAGTSLAVAAGLPLYQQAGIIARINLLVCNNSGLLHIASAVGTPTVSTMGPTDPVYWYPQGRRQAVIRKPLACSPCSRAICPEHACMESISVEEMEAAAKGLLEEGRRQ